MSNISDVLRNKHLTQPTLAPSNQPYTPHPRW